MNTHEQYLEKTRSAQEHLFLAIESYKSFLAPTKIAMFSGTFASEEESEIARKSWGKANEAVIQDSLAGQRRYMAESISIAVLSGAILALAEKFLEMFSTNSEPVDNLGFDLSSNKLKYCVGRRINGIPLGLVVHAARNQHFHFESPSNHSPVSEVFLALSRRVSHSSNEVYFDPAFQLTEHTRPFMAANVLDLIGWRSAEEYMAEMNALIGGNDN